ncbi:MAG: Lrp/AsnC family transcriptional regulator [Clostridia bacterium]|jgi:DNA-binding Lrp family transcriptional regulator|nr:Lrp/AsnC family transcriptional regulator [Clostridia bacterium]MDH7572190.1 Lrp/AsnC family transcriptional regulator [Clostridia bacterium]
MEKRILEILAGDARLTPEQIAAMIGAPPEEVAAVVRRLEEERVIVKYQTLINWEKVGDSGVAALIEVKVTPQRDLGFDQVAARIYRFPEVRSVFLVSGSYDLSVMVEGKDLKEVARFVAEKLATLEHVQSTVTHFVLKTYKQDGVILEDQETDRRQVVSP